MSLAGCAAQSLIGLVILKSLCLIAGLFSFDYKKRRRAVKLSLALLVYWDIVILMLPWCLVSIDGIEAFKIPARTPLGLL